MSTDLSLQAPSEGVSLSGSAPGRLPFVLTVSILGVLGSAVSAWLHLGWVSAWVVTLSVALAIVGYAAVMRDAVLGRLILLGSIVGVVEVLGADRWAVVSHTLVYAPHGPYFIESPGYMPFSWLAATVQFCLLSLWLTGKFGLKKAMVLTAVVGGLNLPMYEQLAKWADWWYYQNVPMILSTPYYVIAGEILIGALFPPVARIALRGSLRTVAITGVLFGLWLWAAGWMAYQFLG